MTKFKNIKIKLDLTNIGSIRMEGLKESKDQDVNLVSMEGKIIVAPLKAAQMLPLINSIPNLDGRKKITLPTVRADTLVKVIEYCTHYVEEPMTNFESLKSVDLSKSMQTFYVNFIAELTNDALYYLTVAASELEIMPLLNLCSARIVILTKGMNVEEIKLNLGGAWSLIENSSVVYWTISEIIYPALIADSARLQTGLKVRDAVIVHKGSAITRLETTVAAQSEAVAQSTEEVDALRALLAKQASDIDTLRVRQGLLLKNILDQNRFFTALTSNMQVGLHQQHLPNDGGSVVPHSQIQQDLITNLQSEIETLHSMLN